jgi:hypothetical protein
MGSAEGHVKGPERTARITLGQKDVDDMSNKQNELAFHINNVKHLMVRARRREESLYNYESLLKYLSKEYMSECQRLNMQPENTATSGVIDLGEFTFLESPTPRQSSVWNLFAVYTDNCKPSQIIVNNVTTICIFPDGTKIISRPMPGEEFDLETGVAMCITKYIYGSRQAFKKAARSAHIQPGKRASDGTD